MKIGIIGSGQVAQIVGAGLIRHGHEVMLGTRDLSKLIDWAEENNGITGSFADASEFGEILILAVKGEVAVDLVKSIKDKIGRKLVLDATNPIDSNKPPVNGVIQFFTDLNRSLMEELQETVPVAHFVKAFNSIGNAHMIDPDFGNSKPTMFICGNDENAKKEATKLLESIGHEVEDMGSAVSARVIEPLCILWCIPGMLRGEWTHTFKLLKK